MSNKHCKDKKYCNQCNGVLNCPKCGPQKCWKEGTDYLNGEKHLYRECRNCQFKDVWHIEEVE